MFSLLDETQPPHVPVRAALLYFEILKDRLSERVKGTPVKF